MCIGYTCSGMASVEIWTLSHPKWMRRCSKPNTTHVTNLGTALVDCHARHMTALAQGSCDQSASQSPRGTVVHLMYDERTS